MKNLHFALLGTSVLIFSLALLQAGGQKTSLLLKQPLADPVAIHNMLVIGEKTVFLSHLPMFQEKGEPPMPHRYQAILEVEFQQQGRDPQNDYRKDHQSHPNTKIYTINPEPFVLPTLVSSGIQQESLHKFKAGIFRGHLEKDGARILSNVDVDVKRVIYFQKFDTSAKRPTQLEYLLFGKGGELFLAHLITAPPDFDQVLSVSVMDTSFNDEELAKGIRVSFPGTINSPAARLKEKQQTEGAVVLNNKSIQPKIKLNISKEFYFEEGEMRTPPNFQTTAEEKKAGFK